MLGRHFLARAAGIQILQLARLPASTPWLKRLKIALLEEDTNGIRK